MPAAGSVSLLLDVVPFMAPSWCRSLRAPPAARVRLGVMPTPLHRWSPPCLASSGAEVYIKRDDMSGGPELGGNKVRKLEFLLAAALSQGADCIVTIGGVQSNHARATTSAARMLGLDAHLVLRVSDRAADAEIGFDGNLLFERLAGATIRTVTKSEYARHGSEMLTATLAEQLRAAGRRPYVIPVGGSNALGTWGYLSAVEELLGQIGSSPPPDHIVVACGSGGTAAGIALGVWLAGLKHTTVHAVGVCDSPGYFYKHIGELIEEMGVDLNGRAVEDLLVIHQGKGIGYSMSTEAELRTIAETAAATGVTLDATYSGKALHVFAELMRAEPERFASSRVLFWHTGGALGMYDRTSSFQALMPDHQVTPLLPRHSS